MTGSHAAGELHSHGTMLWLDARAKILALIGMVFVVVSTPASAWQAFVAYWVLLLLYGLAGRVPPLLIARRLIVVLPFVLLVVILLPFIRPDVSKGEYWVNVAGMHLSSGGLNTVYNVVLKSLTSVCALMMLSATTSFPDLMRGFERLWIPRIFIEIVAFAWRYLYVFRDEALRMKRARDARAWRGRWLWQAWTIGLMIGSLFLRAYERAERVYHAMKARGYEGQTHSAKPRQMARPDWGLIMLFAVSLTIIRLWVWQTH